MSIWLQKSVLIQPRTSLPKFLRNGKKMAAQALRVDTAAILSHGAALGGKFCFAELPEEAFRSLAPDLAAVTELLITAQTFFQSLKFEFDPITLKLWRARSRLYRQLR